MRHATTTAVALAALGSACLLCASPAIAADGSQHWAYRPIHAVAPPAPATPGSGTGHPIDAFIRERLTAGGLQPNPTADRRTLIRRIYFDLTGLPPAPAEVEDFIRDPAPDAYERRVDRLLASPRHGERWARHWLDAVRYTESQGFEYDKLRDNAWHYRDYVIQSLNADKPYDRFMREQVAGDVLNPPTSEGIIAASLLVCGAWDEAGNAQANKIQRMTTREEEMEDLVSVVGQTFLGLTVNCARCHDHKFDPIPQVDYFRLRSVFDGVKHGQRVAAPAEESARHDAKGRQLKARVSEISQEIATLEWKGAQVVMSQKRTEPAKGPAPTAPRMSWTFGSQSGLEGAGTLEGGATVSEGRLQLGTEGAFFRSHPLPFAFKEKTLEAWVSLADLSQGGGAAISIEQPDGRVFDAIVYGERQGRKWTAGSDGFARTKDLNAPEETVPPSGWVHVAATYNAGGEIALYRNGEPYGKPYKPAGEPIHFTAGGSRILLGMRHTGGGKPFLKGSILGAAIHDRALTADEIAALHRSSPLLIPRDEGIAALSAEDRRSRHLLMESLEQAQAELAAHKPLPVSYAGIREQPAPTHRLKRGDVNTPAEVVAPGALSVIQTLPNDFGLQPDAPEAERRRRFADWLADPRNPLPARVMMNRIWHLHFGQGLVATPNDFGKAGTAPTHPELLDWLAAEFIRSGWSLRAMHRLIVTSETYRQSSELRPEASRVDADNTLLWRYAPRRLEAEAVRDFMLAVSGQLELRMGGPGFRPFDILTFPANAYVPVDREGPDFNRRTVYRMNVNSGKEPLLDAFDCPDPSVKTPRRGVTTTPLQALSLMNNSFVQRQADHLARRASDEAGGGPDRAVTRAYEISLGRPPTSQEKVRAVQVASEQGLPHVTWALLNSTEFLYVR